MKIMIFLPNHTLAIERGDTTHIKELVSNLSKFADIDLIKADDKAITENVSLTVKALRIVKGLARGSLSILRERPDLVYTRSGQAIFALILAKIFRIPIIVEINGLSIDELNMASRISWIQRQISYIKSLLDNKTFRFADHLVAVSPYIKEILEADYKIISKKVTVIENGANTKLFRPMNISEARRELKLDETHNYICFVGALYEWQGVEYLVNASPNILKELPQSIFLIVGDGPSRESLTNLADQNGVLDKFIFTGMIPYEKVNIYINSSDICVIPRPPIKGSPLKLYEYMACGKPIVASDIDGIHEILKESKSGVCVAPRDPYELSEAIVSLLQDPESRKKMGESGRKYVVENRSWENVAAKVFEVCQRVAKKG